MIFDALENLGVYSQIHPCFADVQKFIAETDLAALPNGDYPVFATGAYASVNEYFTKSLEDCFIECHRKYIDIQIIIHGAEKIGVANKRLCEEEPYIEERDLQKLTGDVDFITLIPGFFTVFMPQDAHEPGVSCTSEPVAVKKVVFKIPIVSAAYV